MLLWRGGCCSGSAAAIAGDMGGRLEYVASWAGGAALLVCSGSAAEHTGDAWI